MNPNDHLIRQLSTAFVDCPDCKGNGKIEQPSPRDPKQVGGLAEIKMDRWCQRCDGSGKVSRL